MIQALIPLGLAAVGDALDAEVRQLAGERYRRVGRTPGRVRWTKQEGAVFLGDHKVPIRYQRVRDVWHNVDVPLSVYQAFGKPKEMDEGLLRRVLLGLSCGRYREAVEAVPPAFGLSRSSVSRRFISASSRKLERLLKRDLRKLSLAAVIVDGKTFGDDALMIAVGVQLSGEKVFLGCGADGDRERAGPRRFKSVPRRQDSFGPTGLLS